MSEIPRNFEEKTDVGSKTTQRVLSASEIPIFPELGILLAGVITARYGFSWARYDPFVFQVLASVQGEGEALIGDQWVRVPPGFAYITPPGVPHAYRALPDIPWQISWVNYSDVPVDIIKFVPATPTIIPVPSRQFWLTLETTFEFLKNRLTPALTDVLGTLIHQSVCHALRTKSYQPKLTKLWRAVEADLRRPWTLEDLSSVAGMSREKLRRVSLEEVHLSPMHYLARIRCKRAAEMISRGDDKISTIAESVGYSDPFTFSTAFKREMGISPSRFR